MSEHFDLLQNATEAIPAEQREWLLIARQVARELRADVVERDAANALPQREVALLRDSGLLTATLPSSVGGGGQDLLLGSRVTRIIARTDASIAQLLAYHYAWAAVAGSLGTPQGAFAIEQTAAQLWLWASPGSNRSGLPILTPTDTGYTLTGDTAFATGAPVADRLLVQSVHSETRRLVIVSIDAHGPRIRHHGEWDTLGQRLSTSTAVELSEVAVTPGDMLAQLDILGEATSPPNSLGVLNFQLSFAVLLLGIAEGALLEARDYTRAITRPAYHSSVENGYEEPFILNAYGILVARTQSAAALVERATAALQWAYTRKARITAAERAEVAEIIASAKVVATQLALDATSEIFDLTGARATSRKHGLDRFWRDARTLSLHDSVAYKHNELGRYFVNGDLPEPSGYR